MLSRVAQLSPQSTRRVYVYRGEGAGWRSVRSTCDSLQRLLPQHFEVSTLSAAELLSGSWVSEAALFVMPGGADLPYCKHLNGKGNRIIKAYVSSGGSYLGLCAGAYYACSSVEFEPGTALQVVGDRELCFFPGTARGAAFAGFDYLTEAGAVAADVQFQVPAALAEPAKQLQQELQQQQLQVGGGVQQGQAGCNSVLGIGSSTWWCTKDYCNGGPVFVSRIGELDLSGIPGVRVLAVYSDLDVATWQAPKAVTAGLGLEHRHQQRLQEEQQEVDCTLQQQTPSDSRSWQQQQKTQSCDVEGASSSTLAQPVAAVRCQVGLGVAVLCATHPELQPQWLDDCGRSHERATAADADASQVETAITTSRSDSVGRHEKAQQQPVLMHANLMAVSAGVVSVADVTADSTAAQESSTASIPVQQVSSVPSGGKCDEGSAAAVGQDGCDNVGLLLHTARLRSTLAAHQKYRDLFLSSLLYEALFATHQ